MNVGWHLLENSCPDTLGAATFLDVAGAGAGMRSPERMVRIFFKDKPDPRRVRQLASTWHQQGCRVVLANEPNLASEGFGGGPDDYADWFLRVAGHVPGARCYYAGMSPGVPGWQAWLTTDAARKVIANYAHGLAVHAYGTLLQMRAIVQFYLDTFPGRSLWISECNFGAGQVVDRDTWATIHLKPFLDWCGFQPQIEAVCYFAYKWPTPDQPLPTPVDGAGTEIDHILTTWQPYRSTGMTTLGVDVSNWQGPSVDWTKISEAGYGFGLIKASEGVAFSDSTFRDNWRRAKLAGLVRGAYLFARPGQGSPERHVELFAHVLDGAAGLEPGDLIALDLEDGSGDLLVWTAECLDLMERVCGVTPFLYTGDWFAGAHNLEAHAPSLGKYPLWWASYTPVSPEPPVGWDRITIWQNSASARVPGTAGAIDTDVFQGSAAELRALGKAAAFVPTVVPDHVLADLDDLWSYVGADVDKQKAIVAVKVALGLQEDV